jgi:hypothetical protein
MTTYEKVMAVIAQPMGWLLSFLYDYTFRQRLSLPALCGTDQEFFKNEGCPAENAGAAEKIRKRQRNIKYQDDGTVQGRKIQPYGRLSSDADPDADHSCSFCFTQKPDRVYFRSADADGRS